VKLVLLDEVRFAEVQRRHLQGIRGWCIQRFRFICANFLG
jgi:hypothetical protein